MLVVVLRRRECICKHGEGCLRLRVGVVGVDGEVVSMGGFPERDVRLDVEVRRGAEMCCLGEEDRAAGGQSTVSSRGSRGGA